MNKQVWECEACAYEDSCVLTVESDTEVTVRPEYCPFDKDLVSEWEEV